MTMTASLAALILAASHVFEPCVVALEPPDFLRRQRPAGPSRLLDDGDPRSDLC
ncbi:MAG: hypothetical protein WC943_11445 [Elusimicrobiota bacterium]